MTQRLIDTVPVASKRKTNAAQAQQERVEDSKQKPLDAGVATAPRPPFGGAVVIPVALRQTAPQSVHALIHRLLAHISWAPAPQSAVVGVH